MDNGDGVKDFAQSGENKQRERAELGRLLLAHGARLVEPDASGRDERFFLKIDGQEMRLLLDSVNTESGVRKWVLCLPY